MKQSDYFEVFGPFADPATEVRIESSGNNLFLDLYRNGENVKYSLNLVDLKIKNLGTNQTFPSINSLLASSEFADLKGMVATQVRMLAPIGNAPFLSPNFINSEKDQKVTGIENLSLILQEKSQSKSTVVLLDGPAGIGKTRLLQRLTWERAKAYSSTGNSPILYIGSRGAKLSNLRAELAAATQQLRANFTFDQVSVLVRRGLLDLAIDGFDELVDADGYHDAWHALQSFLAEISGSGICILAGRDTFFNQQGFLNRLDSSKYSIRLLQIHLLLVEPLQAQSWLLENGWSQPSIDGIQSILKHNSYALRPYFLSVLAESPDWESRGSSNTVRSFLVNRFLDRESNIIKGMLGGEDEKIRSALHRMFEDAATDMFEREQGEVDIEYLGMLCELSFEHLFSIDDVRKLTHKAGSFGLLEPGASARMRKFPHSEILNYFLSRALLEDLYANRINLALRRGVLGVDFLEVFQDVIEHECVVDLNQGLSNLSRYVESEFSSDRLPTNGGAILLASLSRKLEDNTRVLKNLQVNECSMSGIIAPAKINNSSIYRLDARGADFSEVEFLDVSVAMLIVDELTKFGFTYPKTTTIHVTNGFEVDTIHDPQKILSWLGAHSRSADEKYEELPLFKFFEKICKKAVRQFYFKYSVSDPDYASEFLVDPMWPKIADILRKYERLDEVLKAQSGPPSVMHHIRDPKSLLKPQDENSLAVRNEVIALAKEIS